MLISLPFRIYKTPLLNDYFRAPPPYFWYTCDHWQHLWSFCVFWIHIVLCMSCDVWSTKQIAGTIFLPFWKPSAFVEPIASTIFESSAPRPTTLKPFLEHFQNHFPRMAQDHSETFSYNFQLIFKNLSEKVLNFGLGTQNSKIKTCSSFSGQFATLGFGRGIIPRRNLKIRFDLGWARKKLLNRCIC